MLKLTIPPGELWDPVIEEFISTTGQTLQLEHSLVSIAKWESKWHKPFLTKHKKTREETADYVRCMTLTQNVNPDIYKFLTNDNIDEVNKYIDDPMTATTFRAEEKGRGSISGELVTNEIIYYWMIAHNIPSQYEKWHLNRLLTLIRVCNAKSKKPKKMSEQEILRQQATLNAARKKKYNTKG